MSTIYYCETNFNSQRGGADAEDWPREEDLPAIFREISLRTTIANTRFRESMADEQRQDVSALGTVCDIDVARIMRESGSAL